METRFLGRATAAAVLVASLACTQTDSMDPDPIGGGATGGSSSGAGGTGGSSGSGGSGGTQGPAGAGGTGGSTAVDTPARFSATLQGQTVTLRALDPVWILTCEKNPVLVQRVNDAWVPLRDDRPEASNLLHAAHFLDGAYGSDCRSSNGCDHVFCEAFPEDELSFTAYRRPLLAREYVQVGQSGALLCAFEDAGVPLDAGSDAGNDVGLRLVPNIETRAPSAPLGVRVRYFRDSDCRTEEITTELAVQ